MNKKAYIPIVIVLSIPLFTDICFAAGIFEEGVGVLDGTEVHFRQITSKWYVTILTYAERLFYILAPIGFVLTAGNAWFKGQITTNGKPQAYRL